MNLQWNYWGRNRRFESSFLQLRLLFSLANDEYWTSSALYRAPKISENGWKNIWNKLFEEWGIGDQRGSSKSFYVHMLGQKKQGEGAWISYQNVDFISAMSANILCSQWTDPFDKNKNHPDRMFTWTTVWYSLTSAIRVALIFLTLSRNLRSSFSMSIFVFFSSSSLKKSERAVM